MLLSPNTALKLETVINELKYSVPNLSFRPCYSLKFENIMSSLSATYHTCWHSPSTPGYKIAKEGFPGGAVVENLPANAGDTGSSPGLGRSHMPQSN